MRDMCICVGGVSAKAGRSTRGRSCTTQVQDTRKIPERGAGAVLLNFKISARYQNEGQELYNSSSRYRQYVLVLMAGLRRVRSVAAVLSRPCSPRRALGSHTTAACGHRLALSSPRAPQASITLINKIQSVKHDVGPAIHARSSFIQAEREREHAGR
jgi:hypothetical protein